MQLLSFAVQLSPVQYYTISSEYIFTMQEIPFFHERSVILFDRSHTGDRVEDCEAKDV